MLGKEENVRLNADIPDTLKKRLKLYCVREDMRINELVIMAIENLLDELEGVKA